MILIINSYAVCAVAHDFLQTMYNLYVQYVQQQYLLENLIDTAVEI